MAGTLTPVTETGGYIVKTPFELPAETQGLVLAGHRSDPSDPNPFIQVAVSISRAGGRWTVEAWVACHSFDIPKLGVIYSHASDPIGLFDVAESWLRSYPQYEFGRLVSLVGAPTQHFAMGLIDVRRLS